MTQLREENNARVRLFLDQPTLSWEELKKAGIENTRLVESDLVALLLNVGRTEYRNSGSFLLFYMAAKQKAALLQVLKHDKKRDKVYEFFKNDFTQLRWQQAAQQNAFTALSKKKWDVACAFFLLANDTANALTVCIKGMNDVPLALVLCRLYASSIDEEVNWVAKLVKLSTSSFQVSVPESFYSLIPLSKITTDTGLVCLDPVDGKKEMKT